MGLELTLRWEMIRGRKASRTIVEWVITHYEFSDGGEISDFYHDNLALQTMSILQLKRYAERQGVFSANQILIAADLEQLIEESFESGHPFWASWENHSNLKRKDLLDFSWIAHLPKHVIKLRDQPLTGGALDDIETIEEGNTWSREDKYIAAISKLMRIRWKSRVSCRRRTDARCTVGKLVGVLSNDIGSG
jgi:hypothetical protein